MKQRLLVVDDNEMMRAFLVHYFGNHYEVHTAYNGQDAWEWLDKGHFPDAIILDLRMPDISGLDFLQQLKCSVLFNDIPVIMLSSVEKTQSRIACLEAGAADYVVKPFNPKELAVRIQYHLRVNRA